MTAAAPSGVVTFLFTDVEGSTRRWENDANAMWAALAAHDEVLRKAIETHGGWLFKHTGDGVCAAFTSPGSAVDAAVVAQREVQLPVRMGLATGDYFRAVLNCAARVMASGHGGQIHRPARCRRQSAQLTVACCMSVVVRRGARGGGEWGYLGAGHDRSGRVDGRERRRRGRYAGFGESPCGSGTYRGSGSYIQAGT